MALTPRNQPIQAAARVALIRLAGGADLPGLRALAEASEDTVIEENRTRACNEGGVLRQGLEAKKGRQDTQVRDLENKHSKAIASVEETTRQALAGREMETHLLRFSSSARVDEHRRAIEKDRLDRKLRRLVKIVQQQEGDVVVYTLHPSLADAVPELLAQAFVEGPQSWARVAAESLSIDLSLSLQQIGLALEADLQTPLQENFVLPPELRLNAPEATGGWAWWREHELPPMERRRPVQPLYRELLSSLRTQTFMLAGLVSLVISTVQSAQGGSVNRGAVYLGAALAVLPVVILETNRQRRQRLELQREEVEKQLTAELLSWVEGRLNRAASRIRDELDWQVRIRGRAAFIQWWRKNHADRLPRAIGLRREAELALQTRKEELRAPQAELRAQLEAIDALLLHARPRLREDG